MPAYPARCDARARQHQRTHVSYPWGSETSLCLEPASRRRNEHSGGQGRTHDVPDWVGHNAGIRSEGDQFATRLVRGVMALGVKHKHRCRPVNWGKRTAESWGDTRLNITGERCLRDCCRAATFRRTACTEMWRSCSQRDFEFVRPGGTHRAHAHVG